MQAVPLAALNGSMMSAFKPHTLSPSSAAGNSAVYEISAAAPAPAMDHLDEDKCSSHGGEDILDYDDRPSYYHTLDRNSSSRGPSPNPDLSSSPKICMGNITPISASSKDDSSSSSSSEVLSTLEDEGGEASIGSHLVASAMCVPTSSEAGSADLGSISATHVKHWTYEDQFKQLYNLSPDPERKEFLDKLFNYMQSKGNPITRVPIMAKQPLDLYKLFKLVVERGGLVEVIKKKAWRNVAKELNLPASITSAAFTMRSQYVKYLYPYECETVQLSEPQELQMAIDSNKRDRRHSDNFDIVPPQLRGDIECNSPVVTTTPQGVQLISSPTVAFPQGSLPPYSGGFLVAPGPGGTQLVQMSSHVPGIPIVMPTPGALPTLQQTAAVPLPVTSCSSSSSSSLASSNTDDRDDTQSTLGSRDLTEGPPPLKKTALEAKVTLPPSNGASNNGRIIQGAPHGGLIMTPSGNIVSGGAGPHLIQMSGHGQIPIVVPAGPASTAQQIHKSPHPPHTFQINSRTEHLKNENGAVSVAAAGFHSHHSSGNVILAPPVSLGAPPPTAQSVQNLLQMQRHPNISGLVVPQQVAQQASPTLQLKEESKRSSSTDSDKPLSQSSLVKMPVANITIESAGSKGDAGAEHNGTDASLVMTLEINQVVYQGVLFAKPPASSSPQR